MSIWKRLIIFKLIVKLVLVSLLMPFNAYSQAQPVYNPADVSRAVSGVMQDGMRSRGFAANDPRFWKTLASVGGKATAAGAGAGVAAITVGAVTAPAWVSIAAAAAIGAVVTYGVTLAIDGIVEWYFRSDGKVNESSQSQPVTAGGPLVVGGPYWESTMGYPSYTAKGADGEAMARQDNAVTRQVMGASPEANATCTRNSAGTLWTCGSYGQAFYQPAGAPGDCVAGSFFANGQCTPYSFTTPPVVPAQAVPVPTAVSHIPASDLPKPLNPVILAALTNQLWQQAAAQPGYDGLPYPQADPITVPEVQNWIQANPTLAPTVGDFVAPNPVTPVNPTPWLLPSNPTAPVPTPVTPTNPGTTNPAAENPLTNLGEDPAIGAPEIEAPPSAQDILDPVLNMLPNHRSFSAASHEGTCPTPTIELYGSHTLNAHCTLIEENKGLIQGAMTFAWAVTALFIVLSA